MAIANRVAASLPEALELTPRQITTMSEALVRLANGETATPRRGTKADFKAALLGAMG